MNNEEIKAIVKEVVEEASEYSKLVYINININLSGSVSNVHLSGEPAGPPPPPPGGNP